jgi:hypothetical protein
MTVGLHLDGPDKCLEASHVNLVLEHSDHALQVTQLSLLGEQGVHLGLIGLPVERLRHRLLVGLVRQFFFKVRKTLLEASLKLVDVAS